MGKKKENLSAVDVECTFEEALNLTGYIQEKEYSEEALNKIAPYKKGSRASAAFFAFGVRKGSIAVIEKLFEGKSESERLASYLGILANHEYFIHVLANDSPLEFARYDDVNGFTIEYLEHLYEKAQGNEKMEVLKLVFPMRTEWAYRALENVWILLSGDEDEMPANWKRYADFIVEKTLEWPVFDFFCEERRMGETVNYNLKEPGLKIIRQYLKKAAIKDCDDAICLLRFIKKCTPYQRTFMARPVNRYEKYPLLDRYMRKFLVENGFLERLIMISGDWKKTPDDSVEWIEHWAAQWYFEKLAQNW